MYKTPTTREKIQYLNAIIEVLEISGETCIKPIKHRGLWVDNYFVCEMYRDLIGREIMEDFADIIYLIGNGNKYTYSLNPNFIEETQSYEIGLYSEYQTRQIKILCLEFLKQLILNP